MNRCAPGPPEGETNDGGRFAGPHNCRRFRSGSDRAGSTHHQGRRFGRLPDGDRVWTRRRRENPKAVARIFEVKARPRIDPLIIHVADFESAKRYGRFPASANALAQRFWPGPLTLIVEKTPSVPSIVTAGLDTVAIRVPAHPAALALIRAASRGIAAPSANPFGYVSPTEAQHVAEQLGQSIDFILDGGAC